VARVAAAAAEHDAQSAAPMGLVVSLYTAEHVARVARVLQLRRGHALLLGEAGSGRRSTVRLTAHMLGLACIEVEAPGEWRRKIADALRETGFGRARGAALLVRARVLRDAAVMEGVSALVHGSAAALSLLSRADQLEIAEALRAEAAGGAAAAAASRAPSSASALSASASGGGPEEPGQLGQALQHVMGGFLARALDGVHLVVCLDPASDDLGAALRELPALAHCYTDVFPEWGRDTLTDVAAAVLAPPPPSSVQSGHVSSIPPY
jgi:hypothetical protein